MAIEDGTLFVLEFDQKIVGSIVLNHHEEEAYKQVTWGIKAAEHEVLVVHTLVVHPNYMSRGLGQRLMEFAKEYRV